jgi:ABC-type Fe3+/spermidine/putrescine transport system ATPase subunit
MVEVDGIGHVYLTREREIRAIEDVTATIHKGEFVSIVGPSGCGKSTLLNIMAGFIAPTQGEIRVNGIKVQDKIAPGLGYIFQKDTLLPWYRVRDNVALGLRYRGQPEAQIRAKVASLLVMGGLEDFGDVYPHQALRRHAPAGCAAHDAGLRAEHSPARRAFWRPGHTHDDAAAPRVDRHLAKNGPDHRARHAQPR